MPRLLLLGTLSVLCSCGPKVKPLHLLPSHRGTVRIEVEEAGKAGKTDRIEGELTFDRSTPILQWVVRPDPSTTIALHRGEDRKVEVFTKENWRPPTAAELQDFELVRSVVEPPPPGPAIRALTPSSYEFDADRRVIRVSMFETIKQHGKR
jgi:hypothetical protein